MNIETGNNPIVNKEKTSEYKKLVYAFGLAVSLVLTEGCSNQQTSSEAKISAQEESAQKIMRSQKYFGEDEVDQFLKFFGKKESEFSETVKAIQKKFKMKQDGIVGPTTKRIIYMQYYIQHPDRLSEEQRLKIKTQQELDGYKNLSKPGRRIVVPNIFDDGVYYGYINGKNIPDTFINQELDKEGFHKENHRGYKNALVLDSINGKFRISLYYNGELEVLSYASPGGFHHDKRRGGTKYYKTPEGEFDLRDTDLYHISSLYPEPRGGAVMPYGVNFKSSEYWFHGGRVTGKRESHGCVRVPIFYIRKIFEFVQEKGLDKFNVYINYN